MFTTVVYVRRSFQTWHPSPCSRASLNKEDVVVYVPLERDFFVVNIICNGIFGMFAFTIKLDKPPTSYIFLSRHHKQRRWQWWNDDDNDETAFTLTFASAFALASVLTRTLAFALQLTLTLTLTFALTLTTKRNEKRRMIKRKKGSVDDCDEIVLKY